MKKKKKRDKEMEKRIEKRKRVGVVVYSSIFLSTDTFIISIGKHLNMNANVL